MVTRLGLSLNLKLTKDVVKGRVGSLNTSRISHPRPTVTVNVVEDAGLKINILKKADVRECSQDSTRAHQSSASYDHRQRKPNQPASRHARDWSGKARVVSRLRVMKTGQQPRIRGTAAQHNHRIASRRVRSGPQGPSARAIFREPTGRLG